MVVTPSTTHGEIGSEFLKTGVHVLMEKPLATTEAEATRLIELARENDVRLMVGHVERFNPAVSALSDVLPGGRGVDWLSTRRMSAASARITDVDVVMDLMIHDVDVVLSLVNSPVADVQATAVRTSRTDGTDCVTAILSFESGAAATLTASRITSGRIRTLRVSAESGFYDMDFIGQTLSVWHQGRHPDFSVQPEYPVEVSQEKVFIRGGQGLANEQAEFVAAIREKRAPKVTGEDGRAALRVAWKIREAAGIA